MYRPPAAPVAVATLDGDGSMDAYGRQLAERLGGPEIRSSAGARSAEAFGLHGPADLLRALRIDAGIVRALRRYAGPVHLTSHHLARYGTLLHRPYAVTVHDAMRHLDARGGEPLIGRPNGRDRAMLALDRAGIRRAAACIAVSATTARDAVDHLGVAPERLSVIHPGVDRRRFRPVGGRPIPDPYVLFVGSEQPRKNLRALLAAFALLKRRDGLRDLKLVKVGAAGRPPERFRPATVAAVAALGLADDVVFTERVPDDALPRWYSAAAALALPSRYEGFGLPPVEAMACGCPVVASTGGALPEVVGGAAPCVEPDDVVGLAAALERLVVDPVHRAERVAAGRRRAADFGWDRAAPRVRAVHAGLAHDRTPVHRAVSPRVPVERRA